MEERIYELRVTSTHQGEDNAVVTLVLELRDETGFVPIEVSNTLSPYRMFVCSTVLCQHAYLRMNATERGLLLERVVGELELHTAEFHVGRIDARFVATLRAGEPTDADREFVAERMRTCPVSRNLPAATKRTSLVFAQ